ncbi:hypothetical protein D9758_004130 [Tetrapyrgos nigripes]|uniref:Serine-threonine/tyrosine-protein kinase catalytic domain-containing protein n=1 Tax=Tetrapyrgos nigripes TaxID=182062 RepID=A0A8H5LV41_9AGAR|nr:hypothetical protein D9758_004130 [Tetrapyrgos nigripes]
MLPMTDPSSNPSSFFPHSHGAQFVNTTVNNIAGCMDVIHNNSNQGHRRRRRILRRLFYWLFPVLARSKCPSSLQKVSRSQIIPLEEISSSNRARIHSGKYEGRCVVVKVFQGSQAKKRFLEETRMNSNLFHPSLLNMIAVSPSTPFIVYNDSCSRGSVESRIASTLAQEVFQIVLLGCKIIRELAEGLAYLSDIGPQAGCIGEDDIELLLTDEGVLKIVPDFGSLRNSNTRCESGQIDEDSLWVLFNKLCVKDGRQTFSEATYILHQDSRSRNQSARIEEVSATDTDTEAEDTQNLIPDNISTSNSSEPSVIYRRELLWRGSKHDSQSVAAVARRYRQLWERLNLTVGESYPSYAMSRKQAARPARTVVHRCQGYRKEEITLTSDVSDNAIVSHFTPSLYERCPVCKEIVEEEEFRCACGGNA